MIPMLKSCYVLLNRNFLDLGETVSNLAMLEMENFEESSDGNKISDCNTLPSVINKGNNFKLREKEKINYSDDITNAEDEDSPSEFSYVSSSSDDGDSSLDDQEMTKKPNRKKMKRDPSNTSPKKLSCLFCDKLFSTHWSYLKHKLSHESNPYKCILCTKRFDNRPSYLLHMKRHHPEVEPFVCEYQRCERNFKTLRLLEIHRKRHWKYMCKYCKMLFIRKHHMRKHVQKIH